MYWRFPINISISFLVVQYCDVRRSRIVRMFWKLHCDRSTFPASASTFHPRTSLVQVHSPYLSQSLFALTEYLASSGKEGNIRMITWTMSSNTWVLWSILPWTIVITSSIYQSIWVRISGVCGGTSPVFRVLLMSLYQRMDINMPTKVLAALVSIFKKTLNNLIQSNHPVGSTSLVQIMTLSLSSTDGII